MEKRPYDPPHVDEVGRVADHTLQNALSNVIDTLNQVIGQPPVVGSH